jgi:hypothetical protein
LSIIALDFDQSLGIQAKPIIRQLLASRTSQTADPRSEGKRQKAKIEIQIDKVQPARVRGAGLFLCTFAVCLLPCGAAACSAFDFSQPGE